MKNILTIILAICLSVNALAQRQHQFSGLIGVGMHQGLTDFDSFENKGGLGYHLSFDYKLFLNNNWAINTGIGYWHYSNKLISNDIYKVDNFVDNSVVMQEYNTFEKFFVYDEYTEKLKFSDFQIPLGVYYKTFRGEDKKWDYGFGANFRYAFALNAKSKAKNGEYRTEALNKDLGVKFHDLPQHDLVTINFKDNPKKFSPEFSKNDISLGANFDAYYKLKNNLELILGFYVNYGLKSLNNSSFNREVNNVRFSNVVEEIPCENKVKEIHSLINQEQCSKINSLALGINLGICFTKNKKQKPQDDNSGKEPDVKPIDSSSNVVEQPKDTIVIVENQPKDTIVEPKEDEQISQNIAQNNPPEDQTPKDNKQDDEETFDDYKDDIVVVDNKPKHDYQNYQHTFGFDKAKSILANTKENNLAIKELADIMKEDPDLKLSLIGYCSSEGSLEYNNRLGLLRANYIKSRLVAQGINKNRIRTSTQSINNPIADNNTEDGRQQNRRVEVVFE